MKNVAQFSEKCRDVFWVVGKSHQMTGKVRKSRQEREVESGKSVGPDNRLVLKLMNHTIKLWESF